MPRTYLSLLLLGVLLASPAAAQSPTQDIVGDYLCSLASTPGDTSWDSLTSDAFYDTAASAASVSCPRRLRILEVWCYNPSSHDAYVAFGARGAADAVVGAILCPAGGAVDVPLRGLKGPTSAGIQIVSIKVGDAADTVQLVVFAKP